MSGPSSRNSPTSIAALVAMALLAGAVGGFFVGRMSRVDDRSLLVPTVLTSAAPVIKSASAPSAKPPAPSAAEAKEPATVEAMSGRVTAVDVSSFTMAVEGWLSNYSAIPMTRTVDVNAKTVFVFRQQKDGTAFLQELKQYDLTNMRGVPPAPYSEEQKAFADLAVGDIVQVSSDHDFKFAPRFSALEVITGMPVFPVTPAPPTGQ